MNIKYKNIKTASDEWTKITIPCVIIKHRVVKTDPTYKFVINANIYTRSNVAVKSDNGSYYYDLLNILSPSNGVITGSQWLNLLENKYNIALSEGDEYNSDIFPDLAFENIEDRDLFDTLYNSLSASQYSDGINIFLDFSLQVSDGFIRNKLDIDTHYLKNYLVNELSFNLLSKITSKQSNNDYKVKTNFKNALELTNEEVRYLELLLSYSSSLLPKNDDDIPYLWNYVNQLSNMSLSAKQYLFGFFFNKVSITNITNNDFNLTVNQNNRPLNVTIKNGIYDKNNEIIRV